MRFFSCTRGRWTFRSHGPGEEPPAPPEAQVTSASVLIGSRGGDEETWNIRPLPEERDELVGWDAPRRLSGEGLVIVHQWLDQFAISGSFSRFLPALENLIVDC